MSGKLIGKNLTVLRLPLGWMDGTGQVSSGIIYLRLSAVVLISFPITFNGNTETETDELLWPSCQAGRALDEEIIRPSIHLPQDATESQNHRLGGDKVRYKNRFHFFSFTWISFN